MGTVFTGTVLKKDDPKDYTFPDTIWFWEECPVCKGKGYTIDDIWAKPEKVSNK